MPKFHSKQSSSRRLRRFFVVLPIPEPGKTIEISGREWVHLRASLRLNEGDRCLVTDGRGHEAEARIEALSARGASLQIESILRREGENGKNGLYLNIYLALPQKGKMDFIVEKAQELGVQELHPMETERTVVKMRSEARGRAGLRWHKIAVEAAKQSGSVSLVKIAPPISFEKAIAEVSGDHQKIIFHPADDAIPFGEFCSVISRSEASCHFERSEKSQKSGISRLRLEMTQAPFGRRNDSGIKYDLFFGPEGGFSEKEVAVACVKGAQKVRLGQYILKIDTAVLSVVSSLRLLFS